MRDVLTAMPTVGTEAVNLPNSALRAIWCTGIGPAEDTTTRTPTMSEFSPVARCTCLHAYSVHNGACQRRTGRGQCQCSVFEMHADQIHLNTLVLLSAHIQSRGYAPSVRELGDVLGLSSSSTVNARLDVLVGAGLIERIGPRAIRLIEADDEGY